MEQIRDYINNGHLGETDRREALILVDNFNVKKGSSKNPSNDLYQDGWEEPGEEESRMSQILLIAASLIALLAGLDKIINKGKSHLEKEKWEKEEEDRRRRREEEEEDRRRRNRYSSSSSSYGDGGGSFGGGGGSCGGFGGGSSGGGGAGGSW